MRFTMLTAALITLSAQAGEPIQRSSAGFNCESLTGTYRLVDQPDLAVGIERVTEGLPFFARPLAKARLTSLNPAYEKVALLQEEKGLRVQFDGRQPLEVPWQGGLAWTREDGEPLWVTAHPTPGRVIQTYRAKDGERINEFMLQPNGDLVLKVTVRSHKLGQALKYQMVYQRL